MNIYNINNKKILTPFKINQTKWLPVDIGDNNREINFYWLPDSSGILINVCIYKTEDEIWFVNLKGEVKHVASGVKVVANSPDGKYWLFSIGKDMYKIQTTQK